MENRIRKYNSGNNRQFNDYFAGTNTCFIDALAGFHSGVDKEESKKNSGTRFKDFVKEYMKQYDPDNLWWDLRCGLVHSYVSAKTYAFTDDRNMGYLHFSKADTGETIINLEDFLADI